MRKFFAATPKESDLSSISVEKFPQGHSKDLLRKTAAETVVSPDPHYDVDRYEFLVRRPPLHGTLQRFVRKWLRARVLYLAHHPRLAWHSVGTSMYYTLR